MKYKLAVFDMDGTILDTLEDLTDGINFVLEKYAMPRRSIDEVRSFVGNGIPILCERAVEEGTDEKALVRFTADFTAYYKDHCNIKTAPYDGIKDVIKSLKKSGVKTAVVSNKDDIAVKALCSIHFDGLFDYQLGRLDNLRKKPAPDMVERALADLNVQKENAVYIGDSDVDLETATNSKLDFIAVTWGFREEGFLRSLGAKIFARSPKEISSIVLGL